MWRCEFIYFEVTNRRSCKHKTQLAAEHQATRAVVASMSYLIEALSASVVVEDPEEEEEKTAIPPKA